MIGIPKKWWTTSKHPICPRMIVAVKRNNTPDTSDVSCNCLQHKQPHPKLASVPVSHCPFLVQLTLGPSDVALPLCASWTKNTEEILGFGANVPSNHKKMSPHHCHIRCLHLVPHTCGEHGLASASFSLLKWMQANWHWTTGFYLWACGRPK